MIKVSELIEILNKLPDKEAYVVVKVHSEYPNPDFTDIRGYAVGEYADNKGFFYLFPRSILDFKKEEDNG